MQKNFFFCVCVYKTHSSNLISLGPPSSPLLFPLLYKCSLTETCKTTYSEGILRLKWLSFPRRSLRRLQKFSIVSGLTAISQDFTFPRVLSELCTAEECVLQKKIWSSQNRLLQLPSMLDLYPIIEANTLICTDVSQSYLVTRLPIEFLSFQMKIVGKAQLLTKPKCWKHDQIFLWNSESYRVVYYLWGQAQRGHSDHMV